MDIGPNLSELFTNILGVQFFNRSAIENLDVRRLRSLDKNYYIASVNNRRQLND